MNQIPEKRVRGARSLSEAAASSPPVANRRGQKRAARQPALDSQGNVVLLTPAQVEVAVDQLVRIGVVQRFFDARIGEYRYDVYRESGEGA